MKTAIRLFMSSPEGGERLHSELPTMSVVGEGEVTIPSCNVKCMYENSH
jgi:hypothetical protein